MQIWAARHSVPVPCQGKQHKTDESHIEAIMQAFDHTGQQTRAVQRCWDYAKYVASPLVLIM